MSETEAPIVVAFVEHHGRYRVEFDYDPTAVTLLKSTVPAPMRHWIPKAKRWEISVDWVGPLASAFVNAGIEVLGLERANIEDWFGVFSAPMPTSSGGHRAYLKGFCKSCESVPHRPGGVECEDCYRKRLTAQHHVKAAMAEAGAVPYPEARPAVGSAVTTRYPLEVDRSGVAIIEPRDHIAVLDLLIAAEHDRSPICPICGRKPAKGAPVHAGCRTRLLHALDDGRAFSGARAKAFQDGACTVCLARPRPYQSLTWRPVLLRSLSPNGRREYWRPDPLGALRAVSGGREYWLRPCSSDGWRLLIFDTDAGTLTRDVRAGGNKNFIAEPVDTYIGATNHPTLQDAKRAAERGLSGVTCAHCAEIVDACLLLRPLC